MNKIFPYEYDWLMVLLELFGWIPVCPGNKCFSACDCEAPLCLQMEFHPEKTG